MSFRLKETLVVAMRLSAQLYVTSHPVEGQDVSHLSKLDDAAHQTSDPVELRRRSNEEYVGKK